MPGTNLALITNGSGEARRTVSPRPDDAPWSLGSVESNPCLTVGSACHPTTARGNPLAPIFSATCVRTRRRCAIASAVHDMSGIRFPTMIAIMIVAVNASSAAPSPNEAGSAWLLGNDPARGAAPLSSAVRRASAASAQIRLDLGGEAGIGFEAACTVVRGNTSARIVFRGHTPFARPFDADGVRCEIRPVGAGGRLEVELRKGEWRIVRSSVLGARSRVTIAIH